MVDWYVVSGTGDNMTLNVYDKVCERNHFRVRASRTRENLITTCANSAGKAEIRYQLTGGYSGAENPWRHSVSDQGQALVIR